MLNKVMLIGRLGADPELKYTQSGSPVTSLRIATDESYTDRDGNRVERTEWHRVSVFQRQAENCANYLKKGSLVYVEGSLLTRKWQDQQGQDRYTTEIRAQRVQFLDRRGDNAQGDGARHEGAPRRVPAHQQDSAPKQDTGYAAPTGGSEAMGRDYDDSPFPSGADTGMDKVPF